MSAQEQLDQAKATAQSRAKADKVLEPKSVRLSAAHREDMLNAVMAEWEAQNPAPAGENHVELLKLALKEFKKHATYKRTERMLKELQSDDLDLITTNNTILVQFVNAQGEVRNTTGLSIPHTYAKELGLAIMPKQQSAFLRDLEGLPVDDEDVPPYYRTEYDKKEPHTRIYTATWAAQSSSAVVLKDDSAAMQKMKAKRKERDEWVSNRNRLREETSDLLQQFNSSKQIRDGWPEMAAYMPPHVADPTGAVKLPVLAVSRLSERLGLK